MKTIELTKEAAKSLKYSRLTNPYHLPGEQWMLDNVCADMMRGGIDHAIVRDKDGVTVWRKTKRAIDGRV